MIKWTRRLTVYGGALACMIVVAIQPIILIGDESILLDTVELESGGEIKGKVTEITEDKQRFWLVETVDGGIFKLKKSQVRQLVRAPEAGPEYLEKLATLPDTVDAHWEMQQWCLDHHLNRQREFHLMQIVRLEPDHTAARKRLGYTVRDGVWVHEDQFYQNNGYIKDDRGNYRLPTSINMADRKDEAHVVTKSWNGFIRAAIKKYKRQYDGSALKEIEAITDPAAVEGLVESLKGELDPRVQRVLIETLGGIKSAAAQNSLVVIAMATDHSDSAGREIGELCVRLLKQPHFSTAGVVSSVVPFLRPTPETANQRVLMAAWLVGQMGDPSAVPALIDALNTTHKVPIGGPGGNINLSDNPNGKGFTFGSKPTHRNVVFQNQAALDSLRMLTKSKDFGFNEKAWLDWYIGTRSIGDNQLNRDK